MPINLQRSWPSRPRSDVAGARCGGGANNPTSIAAAKTGRPLMSAPRSRRWSARYETCAKPMRCSEKRQHILRRQSPPALQTMIAFIKKHRKDLGVEPVCKVLPIAQSTFYAHVAIARNPDLASNHANRDGDLSVETKRVWEQNISLRHPKGLAPTAA